MTRKFYPQNELVYYAEDQSEVDELATKLPAGTIIEMNGDEFKAFMVDSLGIAKEL